MTRRHRIHEPEIEPLKPVLSDALRFLVAGKDPKDTPSGETSNLFRLLWRLNRHTPGNPCYPTPLKNGTISRYLEGVSQSLTTMGPREPEPDCQKGTEPPAR